MLLVITLTYWWTEEARLLQSWAIYVNLPDRKETWRVSVPVVPIYQSPSKALLIVNPTVHNMYKKKSQA